MLVELDKDPLFVVTESPIKALKEKEIERKKQMRDRRINPQPRKKELTVEIVDPLPIELMNYRSETTYKTSVESSKASQSLKKYVIEQEKNLRCLRLEKIVLDESPLEKSRLNNLSLDMSHQIEDEDKNSKEIHIPRVEDLFKNQQKQILIYENTTLRERLSKMIQNLDQGMNRFKQLSFAYARPEKQNDLTLPKLNVSNSEQDFEIDKIIEKKLIKSQILQDKLYKEKREMAGRAPDQMAHSSKKSDMSYFLRDISKPKRKENLKGVKFYSYSDGNRKLKLTPASILLFQLHKLSNEKDKKEYELTGLLKNSFQNRDSILKEKELFYETQNPFHDLSPSKQFQLRKVMNKKLNHRLEISKEQVNKFISFLYQIKDYHVILNDTILLILKEVRETLLRGKVMKFSDLESILKTKKQEDLEGYPNQLIVKTLNEMMI